MSDGKDWKKWHTLYDDNDSGLAKRLRLVQESISDSLPNTIEDRFQIIDICSGDGRDLLDVLAHYPVKEQVYSYLVELDERLAEESKNTANEKGLPNVAVINGDASALRTYVSVPRADLILLCGVFGNISSADIQNTIETLPQLSKQGTKVIWTRHLRQPETIPIIQNLFIANNFSKVDFKTTDDRSYVIATYEFHGSPEPPESNTRLFTFIK
jgi:hypothetical protein